jgi:hypothetical protein
MLIPSFCALLKIQFIAHTETLLLGLHFPSEGDQDVVHLLL